jgi:hypothetical protein
MHMENWHNAHACYTHLNKRKARNDRRVRACACMPVEDAKS